MLVKYYVNLRKISIFGTAFFLLLITVLRPEKLPLDIYVAYKEGIVAKKSFLIDMTSSKQEIVTLKM